MALLTPLIEPITDWFGMTPTGLLLLIASGTLLLICIQLSITASGLTAQQRDLTEAIVVGFALGSVLFIHRMSRATGVEARSPLVGEDMPDSMAPGARQGAAAGADPEVVVYRITGAFFFGAASSIGSVLDRIADTHRALVVDFSAVPFLDSTGAHVIEGLSRKAARAGERGFVRQEKAVRRDVEEPWIFLRFQLSFSRLLADEHARAGQHRSERLHFRERPRERREFHLLNRRRTRARRGIRARRLRVVIRRSDEQRRPRRRARSANACRASGVVSTGTRFAPAKRADSRRPSTSQPHSSPPRRQGSAPASRMRDSMKQLATGSAPTRSSAAGRSAATRFLTRLRTKRR